MQIKLLFICQALRREYQSMATRTRQAKAQNAAAMSRQKVPGITMNTFENKANLSLIDPHWDWDWDWD